MMRSRGRLFYGIISLCMTAVLLLSSAPVPVLAEEASNDGTVIEVGCEQDLLDLAKNCKLNSYSLGKTVELTADIQVYSPNFSGIPFFNGTFHGNGHTISGISISGKGSNQGFFRYLGNQALVSDLNISGAVAPSGTQENIGGIAGSNYGTISGCSFVGSVSGETNVGGIAGTNKSTGKIVKSTSRTVVMAVSQTGGIAGNNEGLIADSSNESSVNVDVLEPSLDLGGIDLGTLNLAKTVINRTNMGGIAGTSTGIISGCQNLGTIGYEHSGYNVGGIAGRQNGIVTNCENRGVIYGRKDVGGIAGQAQPYLEWEYFKSRLSSAKDQVQQMNQTLESLSPIMEETTDGMMGYAQILIDQYHGLMDGMADDMDALKAAVQSDMGNVKEITSQATAALDTIEQILSSYRADALPEISSVEDLQNFLTQMENDFHTLEDQFDTLLNQTDGLEGTFDATGESAEAFVDHLSEQFHDTSRVETIEAMLNMLDENVQKITDVMGQASQQVEDLINSVDQAIRSDLDQLDHGGNLLQDVTSMKSAEDTDGVITSCRNYGAVEADLNAGGIAGSMNVDYEDDQEKDPDMSSLNIVTRINASSVVAYSVNYGKVEVKKDNGGGIVGLQELGLVYGCESYGNISSDSGSYLGGIAGDSLAAIQNSYVRSQVEGSDYLGGIAGSGATMTGNVAMVNLQSDGEGVGSVAGVVADDGGSVESNYFVGEEYGAIDDISYSGAAEPVSYEALMSRADIPAGFSQVTVTFVSEDGETLSEVNIPYGGSLTEENYPEVTPDDGCYISWECSRTLDTITDNLVITATNVPWTKSVAGNIRSEDGKDLFLAVGEFYDHTRLYLVETDGPENLPADGELLYAYSWYLTSEQEKEQDTLEGHFYTQGMPDNAVLYLQKDGQWVRTDAETDGSYLVAEISCGQPFAVVLLPESGISPYLMIGIVLAAAAVILLIFIIVRRKRHKTLAGQAAAESAVSEEKQPVADDDTDDGAEEDADGLLEIPEIEVEDAPEETAGEENSDDR